MVTWLFEVGAADDIRSKNNDGESPLCAASREGHLDVTRWLILRGAANSDDGHVNQAFLQFDFPLDVWRGPHASLVFAVSEHAAFTSLVLTATYFATSAAPPLRFSVLVKD